MLGEIGGVFLKTLTSDGKYPVQCSGNLQLRIEIQLSEKKKNFLISLFHFSNLHQISNILKKKMIVIDKLFPKLQTLKIFLRILSQEHRFRTGFGSLHVKASQLLAKSPRDRFYHVLLSFAGKLIWNMSPLVSGEILGIFVNTLTDEGINPVQGCGNLQLPIQTQLSEKQETFF